MLFVSVLVEPNDEEFHGQMAKIDFAEVNCSTPNPSLMQKESRYHHPPASQPEQVRYYQTA